MIRSTAFFIYTVHSGPNEISISGDAAVQRRYTDVCSGCNDVEENQTLSISGSTPMRVYGVDITIPDVLIVPVDNDGYLTSDFPIEYTIGGDDYNATSAYLFVYKDDILYDYLILETGTDIATLSRGTYFDMESQYKVQIVVNYGTSIEMKGDVVPIYFSSYFIEKVDPEFPDVKLNWDDYYPSLGDKTIVVRGVNKDATGQPIPLTGKVRAEVVYPTPGMDLYSSVSVTPLETNFADGRVEFSLSAPNIAPPINNDVKTGLEKIEIRFKVFDDKNEEVGHIDGKWNIKNNSNTNLKEVLDGKAVFACDLQRDSDGNFVINDGKLVARTGDNHKGVSTGDSNAQKEVDFIQELINQVVPRKRTLNATYELMDEDGYFGETTADGIGMFKSNFGNDNVTLNEEVFQKIIKDYNLEGDPDFWKDKIVDKYVLAGQTLRTDPENSPDKLINNLPDNMVNDTGLYELYINVVKKFVDAMIEEAERYTDFNGKTWYSRNGVKQGPDVENGEGLSYCYGCKDTYGTYLDSVTSCNNVPSMNNAPADYLGDIDDNTCQIVNSNAFQFPGLYRDERDVSSKTQPYWPTYWSGIDCSGFIQRLMFKGKSLYETNLALNIEIDNIQWDHVTDIVTGSISSGGFFTNSRTFTFGVSSSNTKKLKKGDLIHYDGHVSMVYSSKWGETNYGTINSSYDIVHAYGNNSYNLNFSRKTIRTGNDISSMPDNYGRIKLWD